MPPLAALLLAGLLLAGGVAKAAPITVRDAEGRVVRLAAPPQRIVSLAPAVTENLFAIGAGKRIVGTVDFSDFPEAARRIRRIGSFERFDLEAIVTLRPDIVIGWQSGNPAAPVAQLRALGLPVFLDEAQRIDAVPASIERLGELVGEAAVARREADRLRRELADLRQRFSQRPPVRVFYEIWRSPLITVGGPQLITDVLRVCGGENVFAHLSTLAPTVSVEAVIAADPEAIIGAGSDERETVWIDDWKRWPALTAVARGNIYPVDPDSMHRATPRLFPAAARVCEQIDEARRKRPAR